MRFLEYVVYESKPFFYFGLGSYSCSQHNLSKLLLMSGLILVVCSYLVLQMRYEYRTSMNTAQK